MIARTIRFCLENKLVVALAIVFFLGWGVRVAPFDWDLPAIPRDPVPVDAIQQLTPENLPSHRIAARQQRLECLGRHLTGETERRRLPARPVSRQLAVGLGQVAGVVAGRRTRRRRIDRRHPDHSSSRLPVGTCLFELSIAGW